MALHLRRRPTDVMTSDQALQKALSAVAGAFIEEGAVRKAFLNGNAAKMPGTSWSNQGSINTRLIARLSQKLASGFGKAPEDLEASLARQGLSWGPPFPPGRPLDPFWGYKRAPRTWDYAVGENVQLVPRWGRVSFPTLKSLCQGYYAAQICVRHLINDVRSLDYQFIPPENVQEDATDDIERAESWFRYPDGRQPFRTWLAEYLQDVVRYDAGTLHIRRSEAGDPIALEVVSGETMIPLVDFFGRSPRDELSAEELADVQERISELSPNHLWSGTTVPAFLQIIEGMPWVWLTADEILYQLWNPLPESQYGLAPMEAVILQANTDIRLQWFFLQYFTDGTVPAGFMEAPPDLSDPSQVREWQDAWDAVMEGDQAKIRQIRWVPSGAKYQAIKSGEFQSDFSLYLMRCTAAAFGVTPNDLGFTEDVNRSTGETQVNIQFRVGTLPLVRHVEDLLNSFIAEYLHLRARIQFDTGQGTQHRLELAQADDIDIKNGSLSVDERRLKLGRRISKERPTSRYIYAPRSGPSPLIALESVAGRVDPMTFGPAKDQKLLTSVGTPAPGATPVLGSPEAKTSAARSMALQQALLAQNGGGAAKPAADIEKALGSIIEVLDSLVAEKEAVDNTGGPGVTRGFSNAITDGIDEETGAHGDDLISPRRKKEIADFDTIDGEVKKLLLQTRQWRENSLNRVRKGRAPRRFDDVPAYVADLIWPDLQLARSPEEVNAAFAVLGKALAPMGA